MSYDSIYFWTATIHEWRHLLDEPYQEEILSSLRTLSERGCIDVFAFVLMPNHIHLIWRPLKPNGKETPQGSLLKFTAHQFQKALRTASGEVALLPFAVDAANKRYQFWQRDPMAIWLYSQPVMVQKLRYLHSNPCTERWLMAATPEDYWYSSARFYATGQDDFGFLKNVFEEPWQR